MSTTTLTQIDLLTRVATVKGPSLQELAKAAVLQRLGTTKPWPANERVALFYAIYLEPGAGGFEPFWGLPPRFYVQFDVGWQVYPSAWLDYHVTRRSDGQSGGDPDFPPEHPRVTVAATSSKTRVVETYDPGRLLLAFREPLDDAAATARIAALLPGQRVRSRIAEDTFDISCAPFDEPSQIQILQAAADVRFAEKVTHLSLITPGGHWEVRPLMP